MAQMDNPSLSVQFGTSAQYDRWDRIHHSDKGKKAIATVLNCFQSSANIGINTLCKGEVPLGKVIFYMPYLCFLAFYRDFPVFFFFCFFSCLAHGRTHIHIHTSFLHWVTERVKELGCSSWNAPTSCFYFRTLQNTSF